MTDQMPIMNNGAPRVAFMRDAFEPPIAPLAMPKQVLTNEHRTMRRSVGAVVSLLSLIKHSLRRVV